jgi:flagellar hook-length control protein FliK
LPGEAVHARSFFAPPPAHFQKIPEIPRQKIWSGLCYELVGFIRIFFLAAISSNAIPAPAAPAQPKASAPDSQKAPAATAAASPFSVILAAVNSQPPAQSSPAPQTQASSGDDASSDNAPSQNSTGSQTVSNTDTSSTPASAAPKDPNTPAPAADDADQIVKADGADKPAQASDKPAKDTKSANDNDVSADAQPQPNAAQPDASIAAQAQAALIAVQTPAPQSSAPANDEDSGTNETAAVSEVAKSDAKTAPTVPPDTSANVKLPTDPATAASQSPVAAAQAALKNGNLSGKNADNNNDATDKPASKTADAGGVQPQVQSQQQQQQTSAQAPTSAPSITAAVAPSHAMPIQTASAGHDVSAQVQVAPQTPTPDVNSLAVDIAARSQSGAKEFQIRLDPPELGRVDVRLSIDATGKAEAHLTADHPQALSLLQKDSSSLTQALRDAGLDVSQNGLNFSLRGQNGNGGNQAQGQTRMPRSNLTAIRAIDNTPNASPLSFTGGNGRLDIHV